MGITYPTPTIVGRIDKIGCWPVEHKDKLNAKYRQILMLFTKIRKKQYNVLIFCFLSLSLASALPFSYPYAFLTKLSPP